MRDDADHLANVQPHEVVEALGSMFRGNIEYVGLNDEVAWIQTAPEGHGYVFERSGPDGGLVQFPSLLTAEQIQAAFLAFLAGDIDAGLSWPVAPAAAPKKKRWFGRG